MKASFIKITFIVLAAFTIVSANSQQTSTDTTWKLKYLHEQKGKTTTPPPAWPKTLTVAQDGSGDYKTIQGAINAVRDLSQEQVTIYLKKGVYHEKLVVPSWKTKVSLIGESNIDRSNAKGSLLLKTLGAYFTVFTANITAIIIPYPTLFT